MAGKLVKLTYIHPQKCNATLFEATLALDSRNKVTAKYSFASEHGHVQIPMAMVPHWSLLMISKVRAGTLALDISLASMIMQKLFMMATTRIWAWNGLGNQRNMVTSGYE